MAEKTPELYLSLLASRYGGLSSLSAEQRNNDLESHLHVSQFPKDPHRLFDVLDALAAICVCKEQGDVFFVSLAMDSNTTTLYVSSNGTVPTTLIDHLRTIRSKLKDLKLVLEPASLHKIDSPDQNDTTERSECELNIQRTIYEYSYKKVRRRYQKRGPEILAQYDAIMESLNSNGTVVTADNQLLTDTQTLLGDINKLLRKENPPREPFLNSLIETISLLSIAWKKHLEAEDDDLLTRWDNLTLVKKNRDLSLRRFLQKLFTLHHHIRTILRIAWSYRLSPILDGKFDVVSVPAATGNISIKFSQSKIIHVASLEDKVDRDVSKKVYDELMRRLLEKARDEKIEMKTKKGDAPELLLSKINAHAESSLLAYHLQNPENNVYQYFGGSKLSCYGCGVLFRSFNSVANSFRHSHYFTKGCHDKIYLRWPYPSLLSQEPQKRLKPNDLSLDIEVKKAMIETLSGELVKYVSEIRKTTVESTPPDSTSASGDSRDPPELEDTVVLKLRHQNNASLR